MNTTIKAPYKNVKHALGKSVKAFCPNKNIQSDGPIPGVIQALDCFSGCGGFSSALLRIAHENGFAVSHTMLNHWDKSLETAKLNLGPVKIFNCSITDADPREIVPGGYLDILLASPECIGYSSARGNRPINDQRRSSFAEVLRFLSELDVQCLVLENVAESRHWGALDTKTMRPIKERKGEFFDAFVKAVKRLGYTVEYQILCASDYGDATSRKRLYMIAKKHGSVSFPLPTHSKNGSKPGTLPWVPARAILDFSIRGQSMFSRVDPHSPKTIRRCSIGFSDQVDRAPLAAAYVKALDIFKRAAEAYHAQMLHKPTEKKLDRRLTKAERLEAKRINLQARAQHRLLVEELFREPVATFAWEDLKPKAAATLTDQIELETVDPFICKLYGTGTTLTLDDPIDTVTAGGINFSIASPTAKRAPQNVVAPEGFVVTTNHGSSDDETRRLTSLDMPLNTITAKRGDGLVTPEAATVERFIMRTPALAPVDSAVDPIMVSQHQWNDCRSIDEPTATATTRGSGYLATPEAFLVSRNQQHHDNENRTKPLDETLGTCTASGGEYLATPQADCFIVPQKHFDGRGTTTDSIDRPLRTIAATNGSGLATPNLTMPVGTIPAGKPYVIIDGTIVLLDVLYRMLNVDELARAMSFKTDKYDYVITGSTADQTQQIGNGVAVLTAMKLIGHALADRFEADRSAMPEAA
jgi:DNA (cytosine-5)-methyltransferase 1